MKPVKLQGKQLALFLEEGSKKNQNIKCHTYYLCVIFPSCLQQKAKGLDPISMTLLLISFYIVRPFLHPGRQPEHYSLLYQKQRILFGQEILYERYIHVSPLLLLRNLHLQAQRTLKLKRLWENIYSTPAQFSRLRIWKSKCRSCFAHGYMASQWKEWD